MLKDTTKENQQFELKNGRNLGFAEYGDLAGSSLFYFHGSGNSRYEARIYDEYGQKFNARIIAVDRPGYGLSSFHKNRTLLDWPDDIIELANHLEISQFNVVGISGGAPHSIVCAYKFPDRIKRCGIVVPIGPRIPQSIGWDKQQSRRYDMIRWFPLLYKLTIKISEKKMSDPKYLAKNLDKMKICDAEKKIYLDADIMKQLSEVTQEGGRQGSAGLMQELKLFAKKGIVPWEFKLEDLSPKIAYYMWIGTEDVLYLHGKEMAEVIPNCSCTEYPGLGHVSTVLEKAEDIIKKLMT